jgi:hypothetical protein
MELTKGTTFIVKATDGGTDYRYTVVEVRGTGAYAQAKVRVEDGRVRNGRWTKLRQKTSVFRMAKLTELYGKRAV